MRALGGFLTRVGEIKPRTPEYALYPGHWRQWQRMEYRIQWLCHLGILYPEWHLGCDVLSPGENYRVRRVLELYAKHWTYESKDKNVPLWVRESVELIADVINEIKDGEKRDVVRKHLEKYRLTFRRSKTLKWDNNEIRRLLDEGLRPKDIAERMGCSMIQVYMVKRRGVPIRDRYLHLWNEMGCVLRLPRKRSSMGK